jgi:hypothetical protein
MILQLCAYGYGHSVISYYNHCTPIVDVTEYHIMEYLLGLWVVWNSIFQCAQCITDLTRTWYCNLFTQVAQYSEHCISAMLHAIWHMQRIMLLIACNIQRHVSYSCWLTPHHHHHHSNKHSTVVHWCIGSQKKKTETSTTIYTHSNLTGYAPWWYPHTAPPSTTWVTACAQATLCGHTLHMVTRAPADSNTNKNTAIQKARMQAQR